jgi:hypothetical protein
MTPPGVTCRTLLLLPSEMRNPPSARGATPVGAFSVALVAGPPSPLKPAVPDPATVLIVPSALTRRMRWLIWSAIR